LRLMETMRLQGLVPNVITYNAWISAASKDTQWAQALKLLDTIQTCHLQPNVVSYSTAMLSCSEGFQGERMLELMDDMIAQGLVPDAMGYSLLLTECEQRGQFNRKIALLWSLGSVSNDPWIYERSLNTTCVNAALLCCLAVGQLAEAITILHSAVVLDNVAKSIPLHPAQLSGVGDALPQGARLSEH